MATCNPDLSKPHLKTFRSWGSTMWRYAPRSQTWVSIDTMVCQKRKKKLIEKASTPPALLSHPSPSFPWLFPWYLKADNRNGFSRWFPVIPALICTRQGMAKNHQGWVDGFCCCLFLFIIVPLPPFLPSAPRLSSLPDPLLLYFSSEKNQPPRDIN